MLSDFSPEESSRRFTSSISGKTRRNRKRNEKKRITEETYRQMYPPLHVPTSSYQIQFVHRYMSQSTIEIIANHLKNCKQFSIDTESIASSKSAYLMQIHTIPCEAPSFVILVQLNYLPRSDSSLFAQIRTLFSFLFRKENIIYTWGPSNKELEWALDYDLFHLPLESQFIDLQREFHFWFQNVSTTCEVCQALDSSCIYQGAKRFCECQDVVYRDSEKKWSLQNAILCTTDSYLSKSETNSPWNMILDPEYSRLYPEKLEKMIRYAIYDVFALSLLHKPVLNSWPHKQIRETSFDELLLDQETKRPALEDISSEQSEDESLLLIEGSNGWAENNENNQQISERSNRRYRSEEARQYRNRRRNYRRRRLRYRYHIVRDRYQRFTAHRIRRILKQLKIKYTHIKISDGKVIIGIKNKNEYIRDADVIPMNLFDREHFFSISDIY